MEIKTVPVNSISQDPANLRKHGERNIDAIVASLRKFGQQHPIVIDSKGIILSGNGRYMAAVKLGWHEIEVVESSLTGSAATAYAIADNRTAELAEWDTTALAETLRALQSEEFDTDAAGYSESEIDALVEGLGSELLAGEKEIIEDTIPDPPVDPITKAGDLWILGEHRLLCGDSTNGDDVARLMAGKKADLCFTSPPYGQQRDYTAEGKAKVQDWDGLMQGVFRNLPMSESGQVLVNLGLIRRDNEIVLYWDKWIAWMRLQEWHFLGWYVWDKKGPRPGKSQGQLLLQHEWIFHFCKNPIDPQKTVPCVRPGRISNFGLRDPNGIKSTITSAECGEFRELSSVIQASPSEGGSHEHPATMSLGLPIQVLPVWLGDIYEPFCGSGTTLIAAEQLNRKCFGMEISPQYCDVIVKRWENITGMVAVRETPLKTVE